MNQNTGPSVIQRLDHIAIKTAAPEKLFLFFTEILGLPVIWPVYKEPGFTTGGFFVGDANVETVSSGKQPSGEANASSISGLTFESPSLADIDDKLQHLGLRPTEPVQTIRDLDGRQTKVWSSLCLEALSSPRHSVCLREYDKDYRGQLAKTMSFSKPLGAIGLLGLKGITIGCSKPDVSIDLWGKLLNHASSSRKTFQAPGLPALSIKASRQDSILAITMKVQSLAKAHDFLKEKQLLGEHDKGLVCIAPRAVQGLHIQFSE